MRILMTMHHFFSMDQAAPRTTWHLRQEFRRLGHEAWIYSYDNLPKFLPYKVKFALFPWFVAGWIARHAFGRVDVVDAMTSDAWLWSIAGRFLGRRRPLVITRCHGLEHILEASDRAQALEMGKHFTWRYYLYYAGFHLWEVAASLRYADRAFFLNSRDSSYAVTKLGVRRDRVRVKWSGLSEEFLGLPWDRPSDFPDKIRVAQIGTFIARKGIDFSIPAYEALLDRYPQLEVGFFGTSAAAPTVLQRFRSDLHHRIRVVPHFQHEELPTLLRDYHITVFPSLYEGLGLGAVEAMACGLVPIVTDIPGPTEFVHDGENGLIVPARDSSAITQAATRLIEDVALWRRLRRNAHETAQQFDWRRIVAETADIYQAALAEVRGVPRLCNGEVGHARILDGQDRE